MINSSLSIPPVHNEPQKHYPKSSQERKNLLNACEKLSKNVTEVPVIVNGEEIKTSEYQEFTAPGDHGMKLYRLYSATPDLVKKAIDGALEAKKKWEELGHQRRVAIFLKAAELLSKKYRDKINAATMLGQGKTMWQAEIDSACETIDFLRFNCKFAQKLYSNQPEEHSKGVWNKMEFRPLEGFIAAVTPFNFTAIGTNLPTMPAIMGNVALWKPSRTAALSNYFIYKLLEEAGVPKGVIQFLPTLHGKNFSDVVFPHPDFAGLHFTGSTAIFQMFWKMIGNNIKNYKTYPRIVGETGGKNFHLLHSSGEVESFVNNTIRGAFEYSGQKCSATSRIYIPESLWTQFKELFLEKMKKVNVGKPTDPTSFTSCVIDQNSFKKIAGYLDRAKKDPKVEVIYGGDYSDKEGWYITPTLLKTQDPKSETMVEEIFGPVVTAYVYKDDQFDEILDLVDSTSGYGLTGAVFAKDSYIVDKAEKRLRHSAGNFYINDKCTGSIVWQQPFGGARASGTNDKAGSEYCLSRWVSIRSVKETFVGLKDFGYPSVDTE